MNDVVVFVFIFQQFVDAATKAVRLGKAAGEHAPPLHEIGPRQQMFGTQTEGVMAWAFKQIEAGYFNQRHARIEMWVGRARNHIYLMPHVHQRLAQVLEVNTLPAAVGVAAIAEQGDA